MNLTHSRAGNCPKATFLGDVEGNRAPSQIQHLMGTRMEVGANVVINEKITGVTATNIMEEMQQFTDEHVGSLPPDDQKKFVESLPKEHDGARRYTEQIDYYPESTQTSFKMQLKGCKNPVVGKPDVVAKRGTEPLIIDIKRKGSRVYKRQNEWRLQLALYAIWYMKAHDYHLVPACENHILIPGANPQIINQDINSDDMYGAMERLQQLQKNIDENYWPLSRDSFLCDPQWCWHYDDCHARYTMSADDILENFTC